MVVVNTTDDARRVAEANPEAYHLSTKMTPSHQDAIIQDIKTQLSSDDPAGRRDVQLVTTQIVEAGVDLDFDQVIRILGPMDNVIQAGGRGNREWRLSAGEVLITRLKEGSSPPGAYEMGICAFEEMIELNGSMDLNNPKWLKQYYQRMEARVPSAHSEIMSALESLNYPSAESEYQLIDSEKQVDVLVSHPEHGASEELVERVREGPVTTRLFRRIQPYVVSPHIWSVEAMVEEGRVETLREDMELFLWTGTYDRRLGIA